MAEHSLFEQIDAQELFDAKQEPDPQDYVTQQELASDQHVDLQSLVENVDRLKVKQQEHLDESTQSRGPPVSGDTSNAEGQRQASNRVRSHLSSLVGTKLPLKGPDPLDHFQRLQSTLVEGTGAWLFENNTWKTWKSDESGSSPWLSIYGPPGIGKSCLAVRAYEHLKDLYSCTADSETCIIYHSAVPDNTAPISFSVHLISMVAQMADTNTNVRQLLEEKLSNEENVSKSFNGNMKDWIEFYFSDLFSKTAELKLFIVYDDIDESDKDVFQDGPAKLMEAIQQEGLRIKILSTSRQNLTVGSKIRISKDDILPDIRLIVNDRMKKGDAFVELKELPRSNKQKVAQVIEDNADGLLYVDQVLRYLRGTNENTISTTVDTLPKNTSELFEIMFERIEERLSLDTLAIVRPIFLRMTFPWQPLYMIEMDVLAGPENIVKLTEFLDSIAQFFDIRTRSLDKIANTLLTASDTLTPVPSMNSSSKIAEIVDYPFIELKHRAMKTFFNNGNRSSLMNLSGSEAHRQLFFEHAQIIQSVKYYGTTLYSAANHRLAYHWCSIKLEKHSIEDLTSSYQVFYQLILDKRFAWSLLSCYMEASVKSSDVSLDRLSLGGTDFLATWESWSQHARKLKLSEEESAYWDDKPNALKPIWQTVLKCWLQSMYGQHALTLYKIAELLTASIAPSIVLGRGIEEGPENVMKLLKAVDMKVNYDAHHAIAAALCQYDTALAIEELEKAIQACDQPFRVAQFYMQLAQWLVQTQQWDRAIEHIDMGIEIDRPSLLPTAPEPGSNNMALTSESFIHCMETGAFNADGTLDDAVIRRRYCDVLYIKAQAQMNLGSIAEAAESLAEARKTHSDNINAQFLSTEISLLSEDAAASVDRLVAFEPYYQLLYLTDPVNRKLNARYLCWQSAACGKFQEIKGVYQDVLKTLDKTQAGSPIRIQLATIMWQLRQPVKEIKDLLYRVLDDVRELTYEYTNELPAITCFEALNLISSILQEEFRSSKDSEEREGLIEEIKSLANRNLPATTSMTSSLWIPWRISTARMLAEAGSSSEYESVMRQAFNATIEGLTDSHECNNSNSLFYLAQILTMTPSLQSYAEIINSAIWSTLETGSSDLPCRQTSSNGLQYDINSSIDCTCDGGCIPINKLTSWNTKMYHCLECPCTWLCESCYITRMNWNANPHLQGSSPSFCCSKGKYLMPPGQEWLGVKNGVMYFNAQDEDGPTEIKFRLYLNEIKTEWEKAWEK